MLPNAKPLCKPVPKASSRRAKTISGRCLTDEIFKGKTVVFLAPRCIYPTCASTHLRATTSLLRAQVEGRRRIVALVRHVRHKRGSSPRKRRRTVLPDGTVSHARMGLRVDKANLASASARGATPCWSRTA